MGKAYEVYRYNFQSGMATVVHEMPTCFDTMAMPMWFMPRPMIPPLTSQR
jgi:hypothetical protein